MGLLLRYALVVIVTFEEFGALCDEKGLVFAVRFLPWFFASAQLFIDCFAWDAFAVVQLLPLCYLSAVEAIVAFDRTPGTIVHHSAVG